MDEVVAITVTEKQQETLFYIWAGSALSAAHGDVMQLLFALYAALPETAGTPQP